MEELEKENPTKKGEEERESVSDADNTVRVGAPKIT